MNIPASNPRTVTDELSPAAAQESGLLMAASGQELP